MEFCVGKRVRVLATDKESCHTGVISCIGDDGSCDILYDNLEPEEEVSVSADRISNLLSFEAQSNDNEVVDLSSLSPEILKERGNALFTVKDFNAATEYYRQALLSLENIGLSSSSQSISIGSQVLLLDLTNGEFQDGFVSSVDDKTVEVELDNYEERSVSIDSVIRLAKNPSDQTTQRAIYMNLARCALKRGLKGWSIRYASIALAVTRKVVAEQQEGEKELLVPKKAMGDCLYFRGKALIAACRPGKATKDCRELAQFDKVRAQQLDAEIFAFKSKKQKDNKKLAREIAKWVDQAMTQPQSSSKSTDLALMDDQEDEESDEDPIESRIRRQQSQQSHQSKSADVKRQESKLLSSSYLIAIGAVLLAIAFALFTKFTWSQ